MISRYGISKNDILSTISTAVAGSRVDTFLTGLERYPISIRYDMSQREDITALSNLQIKTKLGFQPLSSFAHLEYNEGPSVIKSEKALNVNFIYITPKSEVSAKEYKDKAKDILKDLKLPAGFYYEWAGQSEYLESALERLIYIIPLTFVIIFILIYFALKISLILV